MSHQSEVAQLCFLGGCECNAQQQIVALSLHQSRAGEVEHQPARSAATALTQVQNTGVPKRDRQDLVSP